MNITLNRKILLGIIICATATIQLSYAQTNNDGTVSLENTWNIGKGGDAVIESIDISSTGILNIGEDTSELNTGRGYLYLSGENGIASSITGAIQINQDGIALNETNLSITGTVSDSGQVNNAGVLINQNKITVGANGQLNAGNNTNNIGILYNGFSWNNAPNANKYYKYSETDRTISAITTPTETAKDGTIKFIPGAESGGTINGGVIDLTSYVSITSSANEDGSKNIIFDANSTQTDTTEGVKLTNSLENVEIKLFDTAEKSPISLTFADTGHPQGIFSQFTFKNCFAIIPNSISNEGGYVFKKNTTTIPFANLTKNEQIPYNETTNLHKIDFTENVVNENFEQVKLLFNINDTTTEAKQIYHNEYASANTEKTGLLLKDADDKQAVSKLSFSSLFNKYCDYNCYIASSFEIGGSVDDLAFDITSGVYTAGSLELKLDMTNTLEKDIYIQLSGNKDVKISNQYNKEEINPQTSETTITENEAITDKLKLHFNNPWANYTGKLSRNLSLLGILKTVEQITGKTTPSEIKNWCYTAYAADFIAEVGKPDDYDNLTSDTAKIIALVKRKISSTTGKTVDNISDDNAEQYLWNKIRTENADNATIIASNNKKRTTQLVQNYAGSAFQQYQITINDDDNSDTTKTNKQDCENSEILEYIVNKTCDPSDSNTDTNTNIAFSAGDKSNTNDIKTFVVDKLIIGADKTDTSITRVETGTDTNILTGNLIVNRPFILKGSLKVSSKIAKTQFS